MSVRVEWIEERALTTEVVPSGSFIGLDEVRRGNVAVVLGYDEIVVVEGDRDRMLPAFRQIVADLEAARWDDPVPADYLPDETIGGPM